VSSTALVPNDLIAPRGLSLVTSAVYKVRVAWSVRFMHLRSAVAFELAERRAKWDAFVSRVRIAMDPAISPTVAAYRVSEAYAFGDGQTAPLAPEAQTWVQPVELAACFLDVEHRKALARHWIGLGQSAHAAIAAYTQLAGELMTLGAHPELLMHVHAAALERVHHAEGAFSIASAYAGFGISPSAWPEMPKVARTSKRSRNAALALVAERALLEGWLSTAYGAAVAQIAAARASEAAVAAHLRMVAEDSARQAEFGKRLVDWTLKLGGEDVALALALAIRKLPTALVEEKPLPGTRTEILERNGQPPAAVRRAIFLSMRSQVVAELAAKLDGRD